MTRADIERMLANLAETTCYLDETSRLVRKAVERMRQRTAERTHLDVIATTGGKATVETTVPKRPHLKRGGSPKGKRQKRQK